LLLNLIRKAKLVSTTTSSYTMVCGYGGVHGRREARKVPYSCFNPRLSNR
jgi:hypothetical protein